MPKQKPHVLYQTPSPNCKAKKIAKMMRYARVAARLGSYCTKPLAREQVSNVQVNGSCEELELEVLFVISTRLKCNMQRLRKLGQECYEDRRRGTGEAGVFGYAMKTAGLYNAKKSNLL